MWPVTLNPERDSVIAQHVAKIVFNCWLRKFDDNDLDARRYPQVMQKKLPNKIGLEVDNRAKEE